MGVAHLAHRGRPLLAVLALVLLAACSPYADAERDVAAGGRGLAKLNPAPKQAYELVLTLKGAPGPFAVVEGVAQYDAMLAFPNLAPSDQCDLLLARADTRAAMGGGAPAAEDLKTAAGVCVKPDDLAYIRKKQAALSAPQR